MSEDLASLIQQSSYQDRTTTKQTTKELPGYGAFNHDTKDLPDKPLWFAELRHVFRAGA